MIPEPTFLNGERVLLRSLMLSDLDEGYLHWLNDPEVCRFNSHYRYPYTRAQGEAFIQGTWGDPKRIVQAVVVKKNGMHIGNVALQRIDLINRNAEFAVLMGEKQYWGQGYAKEAALLLYRHGFTALNLHRIYCGTHSDNTSMQKLADALGMKLEGRSRQAQMKAGVYADMLHYGILQDAFFQKFKVN